MGILKKKLTFSNRFLFDMNFFDHVSLKKLDHFLQIGEVTHTSTTSSVHCILTLELSFYYYLSYKLFLLFSLSI